jgi:hypothetical protein
VLHRTNDDSDMSAPYHQIARLRMEDTPKLFDPSEELGGVRVGVSKAGPFIDCVYQV